MIHYRSVEPVLKPELKQERQGTISNVVFPTGIDRRDDLGLPDRFDVYYGMADNRIGVARLDLPDILPPKESQIIRMQRCSEQLLCINHEYFLVCEYKDQRLLKTQ